MKLGALDPSLLERPQLESGVSIRARALAEKSLEELSPGDIAFCLRQSIALSHVVPIGLDLLDTNPIVEAELYDGDLLVSLIHASNTYVLTETQTTRLWHRVPAPPAPTRTFA